MKFPSPAYALTKGGLVAGKYRILEEIGRGGMGVVYRAEDTKLARQVAIKVLPEVFAQDAERLGRFEREARVLASLNHPNIAAIYGVEEADGKLFLILELVEGQTLTERLIYGPLSLEEALEVCQQIAEGLEGAHEKGIIHRDLKPANVKITPEGKAKILELWAGEGLCRGINGRPANRACFSRDPDMEAHTPTAATMCPSMGRDSSWSSSRKGSPHPSPK
jgi:serine/threonine protein kinase